MTEYHAQRSVCHLAAEVRRRLGRPLGLSRWPLVSIVVLNRDGASHLRRLIWGLVECTDYPALELILVDNASRDDSLDYIRAVEAPFPISIVANVRNESFSDACNQGAGLASGELLLFLNNDAEPFEPGWLRELVACLHGSGAAAAGPTLIQPAEDGSDRFVIHQRGLITGERDGVLVPAYRDHLEDPLGDTLGVDVETITVVAACLLIERSDFDLVGGFTHGYWYGPEDVDLALKLREQGRFARCSGRSLLIHPPNSTLSTIPPEQLREWVRGNRRLFAERWGPRVRREYELDRLEGSGLWAEAGSAGASSFTRAELEDLGFCLKSAVPASEDAAAGELLDGLAAALRRKGRRCLVQYGEEVEGLEGLDYDVAVHLRGPRRYAPKPAQLNVLWIVDPPEEIDAIERSRYDLVLGDGIDPSLGASDSFARELIAACDERAAATGFRTRLQPSD